jgi:hypothetical protein
MEAIESGNDRQTDKAGRQNGEHEEPVCSRLATVNRRLGALE